MSRDEPLLFGGTIRGVPGHHWIRLFVGRVRHPGHGWTHRGLIRRDTFSLAGWGFILMRMPRHD